MLQNQVRIIGGKWRGRKLKFLDRKELRPTPDRMRETLFNWLTPVIHDARCLDLFAGSGALGFEALSRGAREVFFVDKHIGVIKQLNEVANTLKCEQAKIIYSTAEAFLKSTEETFDIIFLDPPFHQGLVELCIEALKKHDIIHSGGYLYIETEAENQLIPETLPKNWAIKKEKRAGKVRVYLINIGSHP